MTQQIVVAFSPARCFLPVMASVELTTAIISQKPAYRTANPATTVCQKCLQVPYSLPTLAIACTIQKFNCLADPRLNGLRRIADTYGITANDDGQAAYTVSLQAGHWTYECKNTAVYQSRPTRTKQLMDPKVRGCGRCLMHQF